MIIPMSFLFAVVLVFARLSADGEFAALLATGLPLRRTIVPVLLFGAALCATSMACSMNLESWGRRELGEFLTRKSKLELDNIIKYKLQPGVFLDDFLGYVLYAENMTADRGQMQNVLLSPNGHNTSDFVLTALTGQIAGTVEEGTMRLVLHDGVAFTSGATPSILKFANLEIDIMRIFQEQILGSDAIEHDYKSYTATELSQYIDTLKADPKRDDALYRRARYLYHSRVGAPFAIFSFALFGAVFGVSDPRRSKNTAYVMSIVTLIFGYVTITACKWFAENGHLDGILAAWLPSLILIAVAGLFFLQKDRLPPAEPIWSLRNFRAPNPAKGRIT